MSDSPPTPPSRIPANDEQRFKPITTPCEWVEDYHPGGYHPVHLGDIFNNGQYKAIRKLGEGSYSTVWLARDVWFYSRAKYFAPSRQDGPKDVAQHIVHLLGDFDHRGPNGVHKVLVFEPMGSSVNSMVEELPQFNPRTFGMRVRYPPEMAKRILKQSLQGLAFLHQNGIAHGDFQPGNMLFSLNDINSESEYVLRQAKNAQSGSISLPVERLDGKPDKWAPRYLCTAQPLSTFTQYTEGFKIKLSDMGGAYFFTDPPLKLATPLGLRAPELILKSTVNPTLDVWSFGCLVFELITGQPLFCVPGGEFEDDDHLLSLTSQLGPLPYELFKHWKTSSFYFTPEGKLYNCQVGGCEEGEEPLVLEQTSMEELFDEAGPDISDEEASTIKRLIRRILQYDPAKRPSPSEILQDPWFSELEMVHMNGVVETQND